MTLLIPEGKCGTAVVKQIQMRVKGATVEIKMYKGKIHINYLS